MALIGMRDVCWGFGEAPLLENIAFQIEKGERVCLVGRNGVGKSTLLKLLEELIFEYQGTLLLVSHDRAFLNNVVTSTIVFEGNGQVVEYNGGYDDWLSQRPQRAAERLPGKNNRKKVRPKPKARPSRKLGYMQKREMQDLPQKIEALESEQKELFVILSAPLFYKKGKGEIVGVKSNLDRVEREIETAYRRWEELETMKSQEDT